MAGSIPIKGMSYVARKISIAFVVAVLQATTISLHPLEIRKSTTSKQRSVISFFDF